MVVAMDEASDNLYGGFNEFTPAGSLGTPGYAQFVFDVAPSANGIVSMRQNSGSLTGNWSPVTSYLVVSAQIQCRGEALSAPFVSGNIGTYVGVASSFAPVLCEISTAGQPCTVNAEAVNYDPFVVREVVLTSDSELSVLDFALYWRNRTGTVRPVMLPPSGSTFSIKIALTQRA
jgi:hypothetical protein